MSSLTDEHIEFITRKINSSNILSAEMKEDLIDHFCCAVEEEMKKGISFEKSYDKAYQNICPDGFDEIQRETVFLLTIKNNRNMKRLMYVSGYLSAIGITTTIFMKANHLVGGQFVLFGTAVILTFLFLPALFVNLYKRELTKSFDNKLKYMSGFAGAALLIAYAVFKLFHWPWTSLIFLTSLMILNLVFFPLLFFKMYRKTSE